VAVVFLYRLFTLVLPALVAMPATRWVDVLIERHRTALDEPRAAVAGGA